MVFSCFSFTLKFLTHFPPFLFRGNDRWFLFAKREWENKKAFKTERTSPVPHRPPPVPICANPLLLLWRNFPCFSEDTCSVCVLYPSALTSSKNSKPLCLFPALLVFHSLLHTGCSSLAYKSLFPSILEKKKNKNKTKTFPLNYCLSVCPTLQETLFKIIMDYHFLQISVLFSRIPWFPPLIIFSPFPIFPASNSFSPLPCTIILVQYRIISNFGYWMIFLLLSQSAQ